MSIGILECTLRDGAYITNGEFGSEVIKGIIYHLAKACVENIEVGWLKNEPHLKGSTYFKDSKEIAEYLPQNRGDENYIAMMDYGRYDLANLSDYDGSSINTIRLVFPLDKFKEAIEFSKQITQKGYKLHLQAANTPSYSDFDLLNLCELVNKIKPESLAIVDTFGIMYAANLAHIFMLINHNLDKNIKIGFHSHNNLQLSFALSMEFANLAKELKRDVLIDSSLCGMGRGAGNTTTELIANYLNSFYNSDYDINLIYDCIDIYMKKFIEKYKWGYSIPLCIAGQLGSHVNNIAYLQNAYKASNKEIKITLESLPPKQRVLYDYDILKEAYVNALKQEINDEAAVESLKEAIKGREILFISPGVNATKQKAVVESYIKEKQPLVVGINAILEGYKFDFLFFSNKIRYEFAKVQNPKICDSTQILLTSNIENIDSSVLKFNINNLIKTKWKFFNNSTIIALRLFAKVGVSKINLAGFDGFSELEGDYSYYLLENGVKGYEKEQINKDISEMLAEFIDKSGVKVEFVTKSVFSKVK